jgi:glycosyltransferase involved in cell wall biosynthesis
MRITVITPAFNVGPFIAATLTSVCAQTHTDWRLIAVDDGSTDDTAAVIDGFADPRILLIRQPNAGVSAARNRGIAEMDGDAVMFLDGDDWLAPDALARLAATLQQHDAVAAYGAYCFVPQDGSRVVDIKAGPFPCGDILRRLVVRNLFANGGHMLIRRAAIARAGMFRRDIVYGEDWEYWCRLAVCGRFAVVPGAAPLLFVRQRGGGAYLKMASNPQAFAPCMTAIFSNPVVIAQLGDAQAARLRPRTEAENRWIVGRELLRHGKRADGLAWLRRSFADRPSARRAVLLATAHALSVLPRPLHGPFRAYGRFTA